MEKPIKTESSELQAMRNVIDYITNLENQIANLSDLRNSDLEIGINAYKEVFISREDGESLFNRKDVTEQFKSCVVKYCSESKIFEVQGMKFKATCERID